MWIVNPKGSQLKQKSHENQLENNSFDLPMHSDKGLTIDLNKSQHEAQALLKKMYYLYSPDNFNSQHSNLPFKNIQNNKEHIKPQQLLRNICFQYPNKQNNKYFTMYLPIFLRLEIIRINELVVSHHKGSIYALVHYDIDVTNLPNVLIEYIKLHCIQRLFFESIRTWNINQSSTKLQRQKVQKIDDRILLRSRFYSIFQTRVLTDIQWAPNETAYMLLSIKSQKITIQKNQSQQYRKIISQIKKCSQQRMKKFNEAGIAIRFNMMDYMYQLERQPRKYSIENQDGSYQLLPLVKDMAQVMYGPYIQYGPYKLSQREIKFEFSYKQENTFQKLHAQKLRFQLNQSWWVKFLQSKTPKVKQSKIQREIQPNFQIQNPVGKRFVKKNYCHSICNAHYALPLSRMPLSPFIKLFLPPYLFALLALMIYWQPIGLLAIAGRMTAFILLFLHFHTRLLIFTQQIHNLPKFSYIQIFAYILTVIPIIAGFQTFVGAVKDNYQFQWYTDPFFLISLFLFALSTLFCITFFIRYYFFRINQESIARGKKIDLKISQWVIPACYNEFEQMKRKRVYEAFNLKKQDLQ